MPFNNRFRKIGRINYVSGEVKSLELPRDYWYRNLKLIVRASEDVVTAAATAYTNNILKLVKRVEVIANGRTTIKSLSGEALAKFAKFFFGTEIVNNLAGTVGTNTGNTIHTIPFEMPRAVKGIDTLINSGRLSTFEIRITWATAADLYSANSGNVTISPTLTYVDVYLEEAFQASGDKAHEPVAYLKQNFYEKVVTAAGTLQVIIPVGNAYRGFLLKGESDGNPVNTVITGIKLKAGTEVFFDEQTADMVLMNAEFYDIESVETGFYLVDFCPDGLLTEALNTRGISQLEFELTVAAPGTTDKAIIYPLELVPPGELL